MSLQRYTDHRSLCDLFKRAPKHFPVQMNWSVYTYYKNKFNLDSSFNHVLLLYVSPNHKDVKSLAKLNEQITKLRNGEVKKCLWYGVLSGESKFMTDQTGVQLQ